MKANVKISERSHTNSAAVGARVRRQNFVGLEASDYAARPAVAENRLRKFL